MKPHSQKLWLVIRLLFCAAALSVENSQAATNIVTFKNFAFTPKNLTINVGDTVVWNNKGGSHSVTGTGADPICGNTIGIGTCSHTFTVAGTFPYKCIPHLSLGMTGQIIVVAAKTNAPPTVNITTPGADTVFAADAPILITATASDSDGTIARVDFYAGTNLVGTVTNSPYTLTVTNLAPGQYALTAKAADDADAETLSAPVNITVAAANNATPLTISSVSAIANTIALSWNGGTGPYLVQMKTSLTESNWSDVMTTTNLSAVIARVGSQAFYRISGQPQTR
jgi:plastocyanin